MFFFFHLQIKFMQDEIEAITNYFVFIFRKKMCQPFFCQVDASLKEAEGKIINAIADIEKFSADEEVAIRNDLATILARFKKDLT